jgi:hypothetical protein
MRLVPFQVGEHLLGTTETGVHEEDQRDGFMAQSGPTLQRLLDRSSPVQTVVKQKSRR